MILKAHMAGAAVEAALLGSVVAIRVSLPGTGDLAYLMLGIYALWGPTQSVKALALSFVLNMLNPGIGAEGGSEVVGRLVVVAGVVASFFLRAVFSAKSDLVHKGIVPTLLLGMMLIVHSVIVSPERDVSLLKATLWTLTTVALLRAWSRLDDNEREGLAQQIFRGLVVLMLLSLPLLASPLGYLRNDTGFQGVLNHPQVFGPAMALLGAWSCGRILESRRPPWSELAVLGASIVLVVLSEARTAGFALVLGVTIAVGVVWVRARASTKVVLPGLGSQRVRSVAILAVVLIVLGGATFAERIETYIMKRGQATSLAGAYETSRGRAIEKMLPNIQSNPLLGSGFGIASDPGDMVIKRDPVFGLPVGAAVEKGVLPVAVLEELGLLGFVAVTAWIWVFLGRVAKAGVAPLAVSITAFVLNMGEATLFSVGGLGLLSLIIMSWAHACGEAAERRVIRGGYSSWSGAGSRGLAKPTCESGRQDGQLLPRAGRSKRV